MRDDFYGGLAPDAIPEWVVAEVRKHRNNLDGFTGLAPTWKPEESIRADRMDRHHFSEMNETVSELAEVAFRHWTPDNSKGLKGKVWKDLIQDEYLALYKADPQLRSRGEVKPTHQINQAIMGKVRDDREWKELRTYTALDEWQAAMASINFASKLEDMFDHEEELAEAQSNMEQQQSSLDDLLQRLQDAVENGEDTSDLVDELEAAAEAYAEAQQALQEELKSAGPAIGKALRGAARDTKKDMEDVAEALEAFGVEPGALQRMPNDARQRMAAKLAGSQRLREMAKLIGRFQRIALTEQALKITHSPDEIYEVELGDDLGRVLPSEFTYLADDDTETIFYKKFIERELMQYRIRGKEKVGQGAIIVCIDTSGSMSGAPDTWAKAIGLALLAVANKQKRDWYGILFGAEQDPLIEFSFPNGQADPEKVLEFAESGTWGGTDFEKPMGRAVQVLKQQFNEEGAKKGDIVFITDGECAVSPEWLDAYLDDKAEIAFRTYSCLIGVNSGPLAAMSDHIYRITDFVEPGQMQEAFGFL